ncbi:MAG TPA: hypothetical protein VJK54_05080, partial [Chthoniobacterales bacterium]|nr:hypothetical protein [Chthoniobacterales bacterium]
RLQGTGNRRQRTDNEKIALSIPEKPENPSFQIGQRVESTTNCQLPTANCDNGIRCHLMMDPSSTSKLGEGMKALSRFVKPSVYPEEEGAISAAVRIKPSAVPSNSSSYAKYVVPENTSVAAYGDIAGQQQEDSVSPEAKEFEAHFSKMIADAKDQAEETDQEAEEVLAEAKEKAGKLEAQKRKRAWENVIGKATDAETAYKTVIQLYMQYRGYLAQYYTGEILNSKRVQYNQDQKQAAVKRDYWVNEIKNANECLQGRQIPDSNFETEEVVNASDQTHLSVDKQIPMTSIHHEKDKSLFSQFENNNQINTVSVENRLGSDYAINGSLLDGQAAVKADFKRITSIERSSSHMIKVADFEDSFDQKIKTEKTIVEATTMIAFAARTKAEKAVTSEELWAKAIEEAEKAEQAYNELLSIYKNYQEQVVSYYPADLIDVTRSRYGSDYKIAEIERNRLSTEIKEYNIIQELQQNANTAWDDAIEAARQAGEANMLAERTKTESAYTKLNLLAQNAQDLWMKAAKAKQTLLSKASEANKSSITEKINTAISRNEHYSEKAKVALKNAQEVAEKEAAKELRETQEIATRAWDNAVEAIRRFDEASVAAERTKTESAYNEVNRLAQNTQNMWMKAAEAQKVVLSKTAESEKTAVTEKINAATSRNKQYNEKAQEALKNAQ